MGTKIAEELHEKSIYLIANENNHKWIQNCINNGEYESLIHWLDALKKRDIRQETGLVVQTALQMCHVCRCYQNELDAAWDQYQRVVKQEEALSENLAELMTSLMSSDSISQNLSELVDDGDTKRPLSANPQAHTTSHQLWQRLQTALGLSAEAKPVGVLGTPLLTKETKSAEGISHKLGQFTELIPAAEGKQPLLEIYCFGSFQIYVSGKPVDVWTGNKGKSILKYMLLNPGPIPREVLMETFWPGEDPETMRKNLYQAIYVLRQSLQTAENNHKYIITHNGSYLLDPNLEIWIDSDAFQTHLKKGQAFVETGQFENGIQEYEAAISLYQGEFLPEDLYEDWLLLLREDLKNKYLDTINWLCHHYYHQEQYTFCINYARKIIFQDHCREDAHRLLMRAYLKLGQRHLALKQYHQCVEYLAEELAVEPMPATQALYEKIS